jgi:hypothetical protein
LVEGEIRQISEDHTLVAQKIKLGMLTEEQAEKDHDRHKLTQHLGIFEEELTITAEVLEPLPLVVGQRILLCSDGLSDMVTRARIGEVLRTAPSVGDVVNLLVDEALANGGRDNVTCIVVEKKHSQVLKDTTSVPSPRPAPRSHKPKVIAGAVVVLLVVLFFVIVTQGWLIKPEVGDRTEVGEIPEEVGDRPDEVGNNDRPEVGASEIIHEGEYIVFGSYKGEPLKWQVLAEEGERTLIITKDCVALQPYHEVSFEDWEGFKGITWEDSSLRTWLNSSFYEVAFSTDEKLRIQETQIVNQDNAESGTEGGNDTKDKVFLLSLAEAEQYFVSDAARVASYKWSNDDVEQTKEWYEPYGSDLQEAYEVIDEWAADRQAWWWLRSPGFYSSSAVAVYTDGSVNSSNTFVNHRDFGVRPALWIMVPHPASS